MQNGNTAYQEYERRNGFSPEERYQTVSPEATDISVSATTRRNLLFRRFMELLQTHAIERKPMTFYADKLCLSPDHFARTIKKSSGRTVTQWIHDSVLSLAKTYMRDPRLNIQQIADYLRFSDQSAFGKFFRKHTGQSPSAYRKSLKTS
ncbi:MAG: AraC family transcriptional regulator [Bacteroides sp.]|nr:AraC family transcriptional regulator [Bacteroides sp.]